MQVEVNLNAEAIQAQLVKAIIDSAIGAEIQKAITAALLPQREPGIHYGDTKTVVQRAVEKALFDQVQILVSHALTEKREVIRAQISAHLTDEVMSNMTDALWETMLKKLQSR